MTKWFSIFVSLLFLGIGALIYYYSDSKPNLLSPFWKGHSYEDKISQKISPEPKLDFSTSKELSSLEKIPQYLVYNQNSGKVYYQKNFQQKISPASFTKLLSAQVVLDLVSSEEEIEVHQESTNKVPTILGLKNGEKFAVKDLLRGAIATSANDAAQVLADEAARKSDISPAEFLYYMNKKATLIGMSHSHFANVDGLDDQNQYSTLEDIAKLTNNVQKNYPEILSAAASDNIDIATSSAHGYYYLPNWNGLLGVYDGVDGLKIAYTENAGYSTIVTANREGYFMVAIVSGADSYLERDRAASDLLDAAFLYHGLKPLSVSTAKLNLRYKEWGDLARKIRAELKNLEQK